MRLTEAQKKALKGAAKPTLPDPDTIKHKLLRLRWTPPVAGGQFETSHQFGNDPVQVYNGGKQFSLEPVSRQRLDHFVGRHYHPGEDDDPEGWDSEGWEEEYAGPLRKAVLAALIKEFGGDFFDVDIGEKGHVEVLVK